MGWSSDPDLMIMFSRNNNAYQAKSRYNELHVGKKIIHLVDVCIDHNIIEQKIGFNDRLNGVSYQSRIWASDWLKERFKEARFNLFHLHSHPERETIESALSTFLSISSLRIFLTFNGKAKFS